MKTLSLLLLLAILCAFSGCANPAHSYADNHPGLSPEHKQILLTGRIPAGEAVAGMTRSEVRLAMGVDPAQITKANGADAWVFTRVHGRDITAEDDLGKHAEARQATGGDSEWFNHEPSGTNVLADSAADKANVTTTVIFDGDRAVRAEVSKAQE